MEPNALDIALMRIILALETLGLAVIDRMEDEDG
jgi:hypothetical protein